MKKQLLIIILLVFMAACSSPDPNSCETSQDCIDKASNGLLKPLQEDGNWVCEENTCKWNVTINKDITGKITDDDNVINIVAGEGETKGF